ncbi:MAG TPA: dTDP-4-dehydrorhamnose reductase [Anaerolineales bacterium]|nr:dTDP-4-dehydrorhamnose reductase [Anaerolineae bacterium]HIQ01630.1 dTDP-4-dehydrorhamnose reductase [Anaerolineales bacterium]
MKVMVIGANGQLGSDLVKVFADHELIPLTHRDVDICEPVGVRAVLRRYQPEIVINTAAYHKVDECEVNADRAFAVNTLGVRNLALACRERDAVLVHFSTDYVFDGRKGSAYVETDLPNPINVYGVSKLAGEFFVKYLLDRYFIVRTSGLFGVAGSSGKGGNFVELMLRLAREGRAIRVVDDQVLSPTYTMDLAHQIRALIQTDRYGLYHVTSHGACSWYQFTVKIFGLAGLSPSLSPQTTAESVARATRPAHSELENAALQRLGLDQMRRWEEGLAAYMEARRAVHPEEG